MAARAGLAEITHIHVFHLDVLHGLPLQLLVAGHGLFKGKDLLVRPEGKVPGVAHHLLDVAHHGVDIRVGDAIPQAP